MINKKLKDIFMCNKTEYVNVSEKSVYELMNSEHYKELIASGNILLSVNHDLHTIQNIKFINEFSIGGFFDSITLKNLIFDSNVNFKSIFCFSDNTGNYDNRTEFDNVRFEGNVDFKGFNLQLEYQQFILETANFTYKPTNLEHIPMHDDFNRQVDIINSRNYN